ncbi:MAG: NADH-quinone oxidoreductase subunit L [Pirellulales bacterium]|nr:NADH-quinone oxidoreductase subunit L [Pirellulales bacterium]
MFDAATLLTLIPALPLAAAILTALLGRPVLGSRSHWPALLAVPTSCVLSLMLLWHVSHAAHEAEQAHVGIGYEEVHVLWTWADVVGAYDGGGIPAEALEDSAQAAAAQADPNLPVPRPEKPLNFDITVALRADPLTSIMLATVTFIASLVVIYSIGYMHDDPGYWRFFTYVPLFVFSMTMLVSSSNFLLLYVFWEAVGVCSYLLVGFWYEKPAAAAAGMKAFLVNRVGDFGFALGVFLIWTTYGTLNFHDVTVDGVVQTAGVLGQSRLAEGNFVGGTIGLAICLFLLLGACGKSAQFPLHVWLPDAMEGPTPVSALIHAATMVTAGVYMVTRCSPLFLAAPEAQAIVALIGGITLTLGGIIALTQTDLKRVLAYSTVSQLGYMFLGLGTGTLAGITAGMFHLFTHAFFKALLFLGAGSVMHAMGGVIDMRRFSGLRRLMPWTHWTFLVGGLALAGVIPFAGFWSKDAIIAATHEQAHHSANYAWLYGWLYWAALATAFMTALYTFRAYFLTFFGPLEVPEEAGHHAHESPPVMWAPLAILAVFAFGVGWYFEWTHGFVHLLGMTPSLAYAPLRATGPAGEFHFDIALVSTLVAVSGVGIAAFLYLGRTTEASVVAVLMRRLGLYQLSYHKFYLDEIYNVLFVWPLKAIATLLSVVVDRRIIDGIVDSSARIPLAIGAGFRSLQTGLVQFYALAMVLGLLVLLGTLLR